MFAPCLNGPPADLVVEDDDLCVADGVLFCRPRGWGLVDDESVESLGQMEPTFSVPLVFGLTDEPTVGQEGGLAGSADTGPVAG